jgi:hypothetical protein
MDSRKVVLGQLHSNLGMKMEETVAFDFVFVAAVS